MRTAFLVASGSCAHGRRDGCAQFPATNAAIARRSTSSGDSQVTNCSQRRTANV